MSYNREHHFLRYRTCLSICKNAVDESASGFVRINNDADILTVSNLQVLRCSEYQPILLEQLITARADKSNAIEYTDVLMNLLPGKSIDVAPFNHHISQGDNLSHCG